MADTTRYVGDTGPALKFELSDETGVLTTLPLDATSLALLAVNQKQGSDMFSGPVSIIDPPEQDADGVHQWNAEYTFAVGDTSGAGIFDLFVTVTWSDNTEQTFAGTTLEVKAKS